ncbi:MAG: aminoacyl-tRNA hydrolase [Syntrophobacteria bacterium]
MRLVVGLGNPGKIYSLTRHNVGFMVVDRLASDHGVRLTKKGLYSLRGHGFIANHHVLLAKPQTLMNRSGQAVAVLLDHFNLSAQELLVIHDDLDLSFGAMKIVRGGGSGGHLGVQSIHGVLASSSYPRLKVGIGRPRFGEAVEDYVLGLWYEDQSHKVEEIAEAAAAAVTAVLADGLQKAMSVVNAQHAPLSVG